MFNQIKTDCKKIYVCLALLQPKHFFGLFSLLQLYFMGYLPFLFRNIFDEKFIVVYSN